MLEVKLSVKARFSVQYARDSSMAFSEIFKEITKCFHLAGSDCLRSSIIHISVFELVVMFLWVTKNWMIPEVLIQSSREEFIQLQTFHVVKLCGLIYKD